MGGRDISRDMAQQLANESMQKMVVKQKLSKALLNVSSVDQKGKTKPGLFGSGKPSGGFAMGTIHKEGGGGGWGRRSPTHGHTPATGGGWGSPRPSPWGRSAAKPQGAPHGGSGPMGGCFNCGGAHLARDCPNKRCNIVADRTRLHSLMPSMPPPPRAVSRQNLEWKKSMRKRRSGEDEWWGSAEMFRGVSPPHPAPVPAPVPRTADDEEDDWGLGG